MNAADGSGGAPAPLSSSDGTAASPTTPAHDKEMATRFLVGLDPNASKFTFQFFGDGAGRHAQIVHGTLDEVWPKVLALNTPQQGVGVFVTISETDFKGRKVENIVRPRPLFADADGKEQIRRCVSVLEACACSPSMAVNSGRGYHFYFCTDVPRNQFSVLQEQLSAKLGTDAAVKDLPRVMRLPGTLHLKDPAKPRLVKLLNSPDAPIQRWYLPDLMSKLGLSMLAPESNVVPINGSSSLLTSKPATAFAHLPTDESLSDGLAADIEEIRSAVAAIRPLDFSTEDQWMNNLARPLAHEEAHFPGRKEELWQILDKASRAAPGYNEEQNRDRFERYIIEAPNCKNLHGPRTIRTIFDLAWKHGWQRQFSPANDNRTQEQLAPLPFSDMSNWDNEPVPNREWAVPDRIPLRQVSLFSGEGGAGKSYITLHLCVAHVLGREWLGSRPAPGSAIFFDAEDDESEIRIRLNSILKHYSATHADLIEGGFQLMSFVGRDSVLATVSRGGKVEPTPLYNRLLQAVGDTKPKMVGIASLANIFAGNEIERTQVQQFISLLTKIAQVANGSVQLISHPSLTGINTGSGLSGSTQWHNAVRARSYLKAPKTEEGQQPDTDLRELEFKKNQYGNLPDSIILRYQNGMFLPVQGILSLDKAAQLETAKEVFLMLLHQYDLANRTVSDKSGRSYAPALFAREDETKKAGLHTKILEIAMRDLFKERKIWNEPCGKPSRPTYRLALMPRVATGATPQTTETAPQRNEISEQDSISRWAQACIVADSITGSKTNLAEHNLLFHLKPPELLRKVYRQYCKKQKMCPVDEVTFDKACEEMFGPPEPIQPNETVHYSMKSISPLGYKVSDSKKWQQKIVEQLKKQDRSQ